VWSITSAGDHAVLVKVGATVDPTLLGEVLALDRALAAEPPEGFVGAVPAYASLLCNYDPRVTNADRVVEAIHKLEGTLGSSMPTGPVIDVATRYDGPDLQSVASSTGLKPSDVVEQHSGQEYLVYCVGFAPGFTYCGALPARLALPRLATPRTRVPAGSVGIAGRQTGIYAVESPGGWNLIGRTTLSLFDPLAHTPVRFRPGDRIRFVPIP
jgi:KipI family sensor histidine kinase inhibitor